MENLRKRISTVNLRKLGTKGVSPILQVILLLCLLFYFNLSPPFMAIASGSMEPTLSRGDLVLTRNVAPGDIKVGDIIVYRVAPQYQSRYGYPASICHRVVRIQGQGSTLAFRTQGDNTSEDPFLVLPENVTAIETASVPFVGYIVLFLQSRPGWVFIAGLIIIYLVYLKSDWILGRINRVRNACTWVTAADLVKSQNVLERKMDQMSERVAQSMDGFNSAMSEYAKHIQDQNNAIQSLSQASKHLENLTALQEKALAQRAQIAPPVPPPMALPAPENNMKYEPATKKIEAETPIKESPVRVQMDDNQDFEVTPELKNAIKVFIQKYNAEHGINSLEITPELRAATWDFIHEYIQKQPANPEKNKNPVIIETDSRSETINSK